MAGQFELSKSSDDQHRFILEAGNGEIVLTSKLCTTKGAVEKRITSVHASSPLDKRYERRTASNGKLRFNLKAANHQIISSSQLYTNEQSREVDIASVKANGVSRTIKDKI